MSIAKIKAINAKQKYGVASAQVPGYDELTDTEEIAIASAISDNGMGYITEENGVETVHTIDSKFLEPYPGWDVVIHNDDDSDYTLLKGNYSKTKSDILNHNPFSGEVIYTFEYGGEYALSLGVVSFMTFQEKDYIVCSQIPTNNSGAGGVSVRTTVSDVFYWLPDDTITTTQPT